MSDDDVRRYSSDFAARLVSLGADFPIIWVNLGLSGDKIADVVASEAPDEWQSRLQIIRTTFDRPNRKLIFRDQFDWASVGDACVLLIDSAVHSGASMSIAARSLFSLGVKQIITYSLIVKRTADLIPNFFGIVIDEHDRAFFQLDQYPNNRLQMKRPFGILRSISNADLDRQVENLDTGVPSLDKISMADLMYSVRAQGSNVMFYEIAGEVAGFVQFTISSERIMQVDAIVNSRKFRGMGVGATLMRWAETYARASRCQAIDLWAIENRIDFYKKFGFSQVSLDGWNLGHGEVYYRMRRKMLYNIRLKHLLSHT